METLTREDFSENGLKPAGELTQDEYASIVQNKDKGAKKTSNSASTGR